MISPDKTVQHLVKDPKSGLWMIDLPIEINTNSDIDAHVSNIESDDAETFRLGMPIAEEEEDVAETPADGEEAPAEEPEELEGPWAGVVASMGEARDALVTTAHRQLVRARDAAVADYLAYYESSNADMLAHYDALVAEEESWHGTWEGLVKSLLVKSS